MLLPPARPAGGAARHPRLRGLPEALAQGASAEADWLDQLQQN